MTQRQMSKGSTEVDEDALEIIEIRLEIDLVALQKYFIANVEGFPATGEMEVKQFNKGRPKIVQRILCCCHSP
eukprot:SAG31_NODE_1872_length_7025_cov_3.574069_3_plen_73_part_00